MSESVLDSQIDKKNGPIHPKYGRCWIWIGSRFNDGYGQTRLNGRGLHASRAIWILAHGELPKEICVCHKCDNPLCVRLSHLFTGTHGDNQKDKTRKGRQAKGSKHSAIMKRVVVRGDKHFSRKHPEKLARGERHGSKLHPESRPRGEKHKMVKLTEKIVREIRIRSERGGLENSRSVMAKEFGVTESAIGQIIRRVSWKHVK
jgi:HNH endonuclease